MPGSTERVMKAFAHQAPDRTPLFEIYCKFHPVYWRIHGRTVATDAAMYWDALAEGITRDELLEADVKAVFDVNKYFQVDMVRLYGAPSHDLPRPIKTGERSWKLNGIDYIYHDPSNLVILANPADQDSYSHRTSEEAVRKQVEEWDGQVLVDYRGDELSMRVRALAEAEGLDWVFMGELGAGTGAAFYPPFMLMWMLAEPEIYQRWLDMQKTRCLPYTKAVIEHGHPVIAMGGDVSCDKGPFISPALYHEFILPVIQEHVNLIHQCGAKAVYTSDGNHWPIKDDFFFNSGIDGYKEVDKAAGMTMERLIAEGVKDRVCIIGNIDARYTLCLGTPEEVRAEVIENLKLGQQTPGGHILHATHSVHEDVKVENYLAMVGAYRDFFGLEPLPEV
ncbi:MAG: uroporphyrinogen decarboxylase family protein [Armatimonadota bacterium]